MTASTQDRPGAIDARPVRHPGRWVALVIIAIVVAMIISSFVTNEKWNFPFAFEIMQQTPVIEGLWKGTIFGTVGAMILGIGLGIILAVMRLSTNPVLRGVAFVYTWFFRAIPRYVLLVLLGTRHRLPLPRLRHRACRSASRSRALLGLDTNFTFFTLDYNAISSTIWVGILGLGLSEAAYMAEIARAGILSVDKGQAEAAQALGMPPRQDHAARRAPPGHAGHRPPDRQRDDRHGQGHLAARRRCPSSSSCSTRATSSASAASRSCPASSPRPSGTSSSARS